MSSVQDHTPVVKELSDRRQQDPQPPVPPQARDPSDSLRVITSEAPKVSPPRFSQLLDPLPEGSDPHPSRRGISTGTNTVTLVNHPGTIGNPISDTGVQERSQNQPTPTSDRRPPIMYDPIRGDTVVHTDDGEHGRGSFMRRISVPLPRPIFNPLQDGNGNGSGNGSGVALRGVSGGDSHTLAPREPLPKTVEERIRPTLDAAVKERNKYKKKARTESVMINGAIALQVIVGAITTGVAAGSKNIGSAVAVLGGISTALASYLAKARGSGEPEFSNLRSRELSTFIREVEAFVLDKGHNTGDEFDVQISVYRERFELIIKTEGEDSTSGTGYASHSRSNHPTNVHPVPSQQQMAAMYGGGQYQAMPPQANGGNGQWSEKQQMLKNEKALSGMV